MREQEKSTNINLDRLGIVIVDMQKGFVKPIDKNEAETMISAQEEVLEVCVGEDYPVVTLEYRGFGKGYTIPRLRNITERVPRHRLFGKTQADGYSDELDSQLKVWGIDTLCFIGIDAAICVWDTAESAIEKGKQIMTARQLIAAQTKEKIGFTESLDWYKTNGTYFDDHTDLLSLMLGRPQFEDKFSLQLIDG
jgi:nicotinamidase-related amidase